MVSKVTKHHLILQDELQPQVGCGQRWVQAQVGRKWVYVRERMDTNRKRIKRSEWDMLVEQTARYKKRNGGAA